MNADRLIEHLDDQLEQWDARLDAAEQRSLGAERRVRKYRQRLKGHRARVERLLQYAKTRASEGAKPLSADLIRAWNQYARAAKRILEVAHA